MDHEPNYLALVIVVAIGVTAGNLLSNLITARIAAYQFAEATKNISETFNAQMRSMQSTQRTAAESNARVQQAQRIRDQNTRDLSPTGRKLQQQCLDWHRAYEQMKSETTLTEKNRHCKNYQTYIETGNLPRN